MSNEQPGQYPDPEAIRQKRIGELEREFNGLPHSATARAKGIRAELAELSRLRNEQPKGGDDRALCPDCGASYEETPILSTPKNPCLTCGAPLASPSPLPKPQDVRERIARLLLQASVKCSPWLIGPVQWHELDVHNRTLYLTQADELLSAFPALAQSDPQPDGWQLVPKEPTTEMLALSKQMSKNPAAVWEAMLAAAPTAPPRPDASGLIEAAKIDIRKIAYDALQRMRKSGESYEMCARWISEDYHKAIRSRVADRSHHDLTKMERDMKPADTMDPERLAQLNADIDAAFNSWFESNPSAGQRTAFRAGVDWAMERAQLLWIQTHLPGRGPDYEHPTDRSAT